jgi:PAS domain S-box-containing protein
MRNGETHPAEAPRRTRGGLQTRIFLTFGVVVVGLVTTAVTFFVRSESESLLRETRKRGFAVARSIAWLSTPSLLSYNYIALNQAASRSQASGEIAYVVIYDKEGQIAADSRSPNTFGQPPRDAADFNAQSAKEERFTFIEPRTPSESRIMEILLPVYVEGYEVKWGTVRVGISLQGLDHEVAALTQNLIVMALLASILCLFGARLAARGITRPIERLVQATRAVAQGDYSQRLHLKSGDELEILAWHFDRMADEVQRQQAENLASRENLARLNQSLEAAVEARTHALAESEAKYRILVDRSPQGILILQSGRAAFVNPVVTQMTERPAEDLLRQGFDPVSLFTPDSQSEVRNLVAHPERNRAPVAAEMARSSGSKLCVEVHAVPLVFQNAPATMVLLSDVTALRELQERLVRGEKLRALGELAAGVAHDFNNNLGIILGRTQLLMMRATDPELIAGLNVVRQAAMDGGEAVRRIQQFSRVREDRTHEVLELPEIAAEVVEITRGKWKNESERRGVKVDVVIEVQDALPIQGSRAEIREALTNLIFNSVDALPEGGTITIRCRSEGSASILEVADTGVGMTEEVRSRMFEPFFTTKGMSGNGLGLSMVYGIVSRHQGTVEVETTLNAGTVVRVRFPSADRAAAEAPPRPRIQAPYHARILVVDDEPEIRRVLREALEQSGHSVETASSGGEGIERFQKGAFDVVLTDLGMADVSGWEVARVVRQERSRRVVLGLVTGWGATISEEMVTSHGVNFVIAKPFDIEDIVSKVNAAIEVQTTSRAEAASPSGSRRI